MTLVHRTAPFLLMLSLLGLLGTGDVPAPRSFEPTTALRVAPVFSPDTVRATVESSMPLILSLPTEVNGQSIQRYTLLQGPALSGVAGRSFTWIAQGADPGTYEAVLRAEVSDSPPDTLLLQINLPS